MEWALAYCSTSHYAPTRDELVTAVAYRLADIGAHVTGIHSDMWSVVTAESYASNQAPLSVYMQCDRVEDGFAFVLRAFVLRYGVEEGKPAPPEVGG